MADLMPHPDQIPAERWKQLNISRADYLALRARRAERELRTPPVGSEAPDFVLGRLSPEGAETTETVRLSDHRGRPVALVFGSYT